MLFHGLNRWQVSANLALSPDLQVVFDPAEHPDGGAVVVAGVRAQLTF